MNLYSCYKTTSLSVLVRGDIGDAICSNLVGNVLPCHKWWSICLLVLFFNKIAIESVSSWNKLTNFLKSEKSLDSVKFAKPNWEVLAKMCAELDGENVWPPAWIVADFKQQRNKGFHTCPKSPTYFI